MKDVLVIDDDPDDLALYQTALLAAGYKVTIAANGQAALDAMSVRPPQLIVVDWHMPLMDGIAFSIEVRRRFVFWRTPIILVSRDSEPLQPNHPWTVFFRKPVDLGHLLDTVAYLA